MGSTLQTEGNAGTRCPWSGGSRGSFQEAGDGVKTGLRFRTLLEDSQRHQRDRPSSGQLESGWGYPVTPSGLMIYERSHLHSFAKFHCADEKLISGGRWLNQKGHMGSRSPALWIYLWLFHPAPSSRQDFTFTSRKEKASAPCVETQSQLARLKQHLCFSQIIYRFWGGECGGKVLQKLPCPQFLHNG